MSRPGTKESFQGRELLADFEWDGESNLTITIKEKPFFVSCEIAASKIKQFVIECNGS